MSRRVIVFGLMLVGILLSSAFASAAPGEPAAQGGEALTLEAAIDIALENNYGILSTEKNVEKTRSAYKQALAARVPSLGFTMEYGKSLGKALSPGGPPPMGGPGIILPPSAPAGMSGPPAGAPREAAQAGPPPAGPGAAPAAGPPAGAGPPEDKNISANYRLSVNQSIFSMKEKHEIAAKGKMVELSDQDALAAESNTIYEVKKQYYSLLAIQNELESMKPGAAPSGPGAGGPPAGGPPGAGASPAAMRDMLELELISAKETLNFLMGRDLNRQFTVVAPPADDFALPTLEEAQALALKNSARANSASLRTEILSHSLSMEKAALYPSISSSYEFAVPAWNDNVRGDDWRLSLIMRWDVFDNNQRKAAIKGKRLELEAEKIKADETEEMVVLSLNRAYRRYEMISRHMEQAESMKGASPEADSNYYRTYRQYWTARLDLEKAMGTI